MSAPIALAGAAAFLLLGVVLAAVLDRWVPALVAGRRGENPLSGALRGAAALLLQQRNLAEHPDRLGWVLAPAVYLALAAAGLAVVPLAEGAAIAELPAGIVWWGAVESLTVVAVFLHGWSANAPLAMIGAYRYVAIGLPIMLLSMFVLIGVALPAESLSVTAIVESQRGMWNVVRQPLGLPIFLLLGLSLTLRGPFDYGDSADLAGGTSVEISGGSLAAWRLARLAMLVAFAAMASACFLGGYLGPLLPGPAWMAIKTAGVLSLLVALGHGLARMPPARMLTLLWTVLLPVAFVDLAIAGLGALR